VKTYIAELHSHTVLSPCAEVEMIPPLIVQTAIEKGINLLAVTDHNASANVIAVQKAAQDTGLIVLPGMELQTREEVHLLCLFDALDQLEVWQNLVDEHLPPLANDIDHFGEQFVVDETGEFIRRETQLLLTSTDLSLEEAIGAVNSIEGLAIPAHVDRKANGLLEILGFVPPDVAIEALEISRHITVETAPLRYPQIRGYPLIRDGDAHRLNEFLGVNEFLIEGPTVAELKMALRRENGRQHRFRSG
jgi:predicted metal-dependent phosphoesterase TrpH